MQRLVKYISAKHHLCVGLLIKQKLSPQTRHHSSKLSQRTKVANQKVQVQHGELEIYYLTPHNGRVISLKHQINEIYESRPQLFVIFAGQKQVISGQIRKEVLLLPYRLALFLR